MKKLLFLCLFLLSCTPSTPTYPEVDWLSKSPPPAQTQPKSPQTQSLPAHVQELLTLHNYQRGLKGRPPLTVKQDLLTYAQEHANKMAKNNSLKHSNISVIIKFGYNTAGENIAWNQDNPEEVTRDWMNSSGHRANILNRNFLYVGFGLSENSRGEPYWCTVFGG